VTELYEAKISIEFVMNVLRQHEIELDRLIASLDVVVGNIDKLSNKIQQLVEVSHKDVIM
jgi:hypothetical protein